VEKTSVNSLIGWT